MKISQSFIERIFTDCSPSEAISTIGGFLNARARLHVDTPDFGLTRPELNLQLYAVYTGEVGNGGHMQFFLNPSGNLTARTLIALSEMQLCELSDVLTRACSAFPTSRVPSHADERASLISSFPETAHQLWNGLDRVVWGMTDACERKVLEYTRQHRDEFLQNERG